MSDETTQLKELYAILISKYNKQVEKSALRIMNLKKQVDILKDMAEDAYDAECGCGFSADASRGYPKEDCEAHRILYEGLRKFEATVPKITTEETK